MELLGQGKYGEGNKALISQQSFDGNKRKILRKKLKE
jgi:hypothetical protein